MQPHQFPHSSSLHLSIKVEKHARLINTPNCWGPPFGCSVKLRRAPDPVPPPQAHPHAGCALGLGRSERSPSALPPQPAARRTRAFLRVARPRPGPRAPGPEARPQRGITAQDPEASTRKSSFLRLAAQPRPSRGGVCSAPAQGSAGAAATSRGPRCPNFREASGRARSCCGEGVGAGRRSPQAAGWEGGGRARLARGQRPSPDTHHARGPLATATAPGAPPEERGAGRASSR